jgi:hypothetical protein
MPPSIDTYLDVLKKEMEGADPALIQDALADAREHLTLALDAAREADPAAAEEAAFQKVAGEYGPPEETAAAYREIERRTSPSLRRPAGPRSLLGRVFGVYVDPRTWGALLFTFVTFVTGILYFSWVVTGASLALSLLILIIGLPFAILFLLSVHGLALLEGRLVEALLGVRMPRRPVFAERGLDWLGRLKALLTDSHTWLSMFYMFMQLPLGTLYFSLNVSLLATALACILTPVAGLLFHVNLITIDGVHLPAPAWLYVLLPAAGVILLTATLHLVRAAGGLHGRYAKWMLVS